MTDDDFSEYWARLVDRKYSTLGDPLSDHEQAFFAVNVLRGSVSRSGLIGYFENHSGQEIMEGYNGLRLLGLEHVLRLMEQAQQVILGSRPLPYDGASVVVFDDSLNEEEYEQRSAELDKKVAPLTKALVDLDQAIWDALCSYAQRHQLGIR
ncbi:MAG: DUF4375 domain-containing protein [Planctomycetota bacterium]